MESSRTTKDAIINLCLELTHRKSVRSYSKINLIKPMLTLIVVRQKYELKLSHPV